MLTIPALCWLCQMPLNWPGGGLCTYCQHLLLNTPAVCPRCGLPALCQTSPCGRCLQRPPLWQQMVFVNSWHSPLRDLVRRFKFRQTTGLARMLSRLLLLKVRESRHYSVLPRPDLLISVPLHRKRAWQRGYNQSDLLAGYLAHWLNMTWSPRMLRRKRATPIQHLLNARQRRQNLKNAFRLEFPVAGRHIAIVDDVVTTGSTVAEIARLLHQQGAASLQVWCLCRTL